MIVFSFFFFALLFYKLLLISVFHDLPADIFAPFVHPPVRPVVSRTLEPNRKYEIPRVEASRLDLVGKELTDILQDQGTDPDNMLFVFQVNDACNLKG